MDHRKDALTDVAQRLQGSQPAPTGTSAQQSQQTPPAKPYQVVNEAGQVIQLNHNRISTK